MDMSSDPTVLRRKVVAGRPPVDVTLMSPGKAMRIALTKAGQESSNLPVMVEGLQEARLSLAELLDGLQERALLAVLEGPAEGLGLVAISPQALAGLIEMQTMGRVIPGEAALRRPTRTDAAMAAGFIDQLLQALEVALAAEPDVVWAGGFRYASFLDDPRPLGLLLEDTGYRVFRATLDLAQGAKLGEFLLALPANGRGTAPVRVVPSADPGADWALSMQQTLMTTPARLDAVLHRVTLPLAAVMRLQAGDLVALPMAALDHLQLEGAGGRRLVAGKLGQIRGYRAVRLAIDETGDSGAPL